MKYRNLEIEKQAPLTELLIEESPNGCVPCARREWTVNGLRRLK